MSLLSGLTNRVVLANERVRRAVIIELFGRVAKDTPVLTGRARGNWQTEIASPKHTETPRIDQKGKDAPIVSAEIVAKTQGSKFGDTLYFTNNVPYIIDLETGHSQKKAPNGMFRRNILKIEEIVKRHARKGGQL